MSKRKFQIGDEVIATEKLSKHSQTNHQVFPGMSGKITHYSGQGYYHVLMENGKHVNESTTAFEKGSSKISIDILQSQIERAEEKILRTQEFINETREKITFMKEIGTEIFDPNVFKAYQTLNIIENGNLSKLEKANAIASLIANK